MSEQVVNSEAKVKATVASRVNPQVEKESRQILNSIAEELETHKHPTTRFGEIADVRKAPKYEETKERFLVISYADGYVYMFEREAPAWVRTKTRSELIGTEISFKPISVSENYILVSGLFVADMYRKAKMDNANLRGTVASVYFDKDDPSKSYLMISCYGDMVKMMKSDYSVFGTPDYLPMLNGRKVVFRVVDVTDEGEVLVSAAAVEAERRDAVIEELKANPEGVVAKITKVKPSCAYLSYNGVPLILRNRDFSLDYTPVNMIKHKDESMIVKLTEISERKRIFVEPVKKYVTPTGLSARFERGQVVTGVVTGANAWGYFVRIAPGIDVLCPVPEYREPQRDDTVTVRISKVGERSDGKGKSRPGLRGVIISIVSPAGSKAPVMNEEIGKEKPEEPTAAREE